MLLLRDVAASDLPGLQRLAAVLNTVNLPNDEKALESIIDTSVRSFAGRIREPLDREYLFVLEDTRSGELVGTSMIIARHGTYESPHVFLEVSPALYCRIEAFHNLLDVFNQIAIDLICFKPFFKHHLSADTLIIARLLLKGPLDLIRKSGRGR